MDDSVSAAIQKRKGNFLERHSLPIYCIIKIFPIFVFYMCFLFIGDSSLTILICFLSFLFEVIYIKDYLSMQLIGLRFSFEASEESKNDQDQEDLAPKDSNNSNNANSIIHFYARPAPFVPQATLSNSFWIGYYFSIIVFILSGIHCFFKRKIALFFLAIIEAFVQVVTISLFVAAHEMKRNEENKIVRSYYGDEKVEFQLVDEEDNKVPNQKENEDEEKK